MPAQPPAHQHRKGLNRPSCPTPYCIIAARPRARVGGPRPRVVATKWVRRLPQGRREKRGTTILPLLLRVLLCCTLLRILEKRPSLSLQPAACSKHSRLQLLCEGHGVVVVHLLEPQEDPRAQERRGRSCPTTAACRRGRVVVAPPFVSKDYSASSLQQRYGRYSSSISFSGLQLFSGTEMKRVGGRGDTRARRLSGDVLVVCAASAS